MSVAVPNLFSEVPFAVPLLVWAVDRDGGIISWEAVGSSGGEGPVIDVGGGGSEKLFRESPDVVALVQDGLEGKRHFPRCRIGSAMYESRCGQLRNEEGEVAGIVVVSTPIYAANRTTGLADGHRKLAETVPMMTYIAECQPPYRRLHVSSQFESITHLPATKWLDGQADWLALVHPDDRVAELNSLQQAVDGSAVVESRFRLKGTADQTIQLEERVIGVRSAAGVPLYLHGVLMDVTARRQRAVSATGQFDQDLRAIVDAAGDGICIINREGRFGYVNPRLAQMLQIGEADLLTSHFTDYLLPQYQPILVERFEQRMAGNDVPNEYELELVTHYNTLFWAAINVTSLKVDGQVTGSLAFVRDITKRKLEESSQADHMARLEERVMERTRAIRMANHVLEEQIELSRAATRQLQTSEARWRSLVENAPQFVMLLDNQGRVVFVNRTLPGLEMESVVGVSLLHLVPRHNRVFTQRILNRVFIEGEREFCEIDGYGPNRSQAWYSISIGPILNKPGESPTAAVLIAADITERKATEAALERRQQELAHIARLNNLGALTAELAHELNQPLAAISAYANGCLRTLNDDRTDLSRVETALGNICAQSARAGQIIRKIMDFLRKTDEPRLPADINRLIEEVVAFLELESRKNQVTFECDLSTAHMEIPVNRVQIEQVLFNLLLNAIEAVNTLDAAVRVVRIASRVAEDEDIEITVFDQGCGFDPANAEQLFQPFYSTKGHGLGMGLAISRMIVDEHGGRIWATSQPGHGTTFHVLLPGATQSSAELRAYVP